MLHPPTPALRAAPLGKGHFLLRAFGAMMFSVGLLSAQQAHVNLDWKPHENTENLVPYGGATVISPDVAADGRITFRLDAPEARSVELTGAPLLLALKANHPVPFTRGENGRWTLTVGPVRPNIYVYKLRIDGVTVAEVPRSMSPASTTTSAATSGNFTCPNSR